MRRRLEIVYERIEARSREIADAQSDWPCSRGCDRCCRTLHAVPQMTRVEWDLLAEGIAALPDEARRAVQTAIATLRDRESAGDLRAPVTCPLLDESEGACRVYAHRPAACRTYGFYVDREAGLWCSDIETRWNVRGGRDAVVFGNQHAVDRELETMAGEGARSLIEWWQSVTESQAADRAPTTSSRLGAAAETSTPPRRHSAGGARS